jgi:hypothetical protein
MKNIINGVNKFLLMRQVLLGYSLTSTLLEKAIWGSRTFLNLVGFYSFFRVFWVENKFVEIFMVFSIYFQVKQVHILGFQSLRTRIMITQGDRIRDNKATSHMLLKECGVDDASSTPKKKKKLVKLAHWLICDWSGVLGLP